jgi:hypothetical protein
MPKTKITKVLGEYRRGLVSEDGVNYRHEKQNMTPVLKHVEFLDQKVNSAPKRGNRNNMHYVGSIPMVILTDWCRKEAIPMDQFARNNEGERARFLSFLKTTHPAFMAKKQKSSQILVS